MDHTNADVLLGWKLSDPFLWWCWSQLNPRSLLSRRILAEVRGGHSLSEEDVLLLSRFGESIQKSRETSALITIPNLDERCFVEIRVRRLLSSRSKNFEIDFWTTQGWSGFFDTHFPQLIREAHMSRINGRPITIVGKVVEKLGDYLVRMEEVKKL